MARNDLFRADASGLKLNLMPDHVAVTERDRCHRRSGRLRKVCGLWAGRAKLPVAAGR